MRLQDRVAVITAAGSGMGQASARLFAAEGAAVVVADIDLAAAERTVALIRSDGNDHGSFAHQVDVAKVVALKELFAVVGERFDKLDVLFNHAGIPGPNGLDITEEEYDRTLDINLKSAFFATSLALPLLRAAAGKGSIIYTSSTSGLSGAPTSPIYGMTKGGLLILMRSVARQVGPEGIRANAICPGPTDTPMLRVFTDPNRKGQDESSFKSGMANRINNIPLRRAGAPEDIANAALFLASDESSWVTGVSIPVDGGMRA
jgi:NAD(P)-dependent dehydrogenase (short-subunit alcohol dehydrogenase family)